jgi:predicted dehydrogenase
LLLNTPISVSILRTLAHDQGMTDRLVAGMVGGGAGAMIGAAHRHAMWLDNEYVLAAGVFGRDAAASAAFAQTIGVPRVYDGYLQMAEREAERTDGADVVAVVTPNDTHFEIAKAFLERGISVVCEKPLTNDSQTAAELVAIAESTRTILAVPHIYSAYAMVRHAARMVRDGELGRIRFVVAEHASGWASAPIEQWRMDPDIGGAASAVADVGTHAFHLLRYIRAWKPPGYRRS